jgi:hypothetical protein
MQIRDLLDPGSGMEKSIRDPEETYRIRNKER